jgi:hypothetical protein
MMERSCRKTVEWTSREKRKKEKRKKAIIHRRLYPSSSLGLTLGLTIEGSRRVGGTLNLTDMEQRNIATRVQHVLFVLRFGKGKAANSLTHSLSSHLISSRFPALNHSLTHSLSSHLDSQLLTSDLLCLP